MNYNNITFDKDILNLPDKEIHLKNLELISENLIIFNNKIKGLPLTLHYGLNSFSHFGELRYQFGYLTPHPFQKYFWHNWLIYLSNNKDEVPQLSEYFSNTICSFSKRDNIPSDTFVSIFKDYYPLIGLNDSEIEIFKSTINKHLGFL
jgi:hypothetical protein